MPSRYFFRILALATLLHGCGGGGSDPAPDERIETIFDVTKSNASSIFDARIGTFDFSQYGDAWLGISTHQSVAISRYRDRNINETAKRQAAIMYIDPSADLDTISITLNELPKPNSIATAPTLKVKLKTPKNAVSTGSTYAIYAYLSPAAHGEGGEGLQLIETHYDQPISTVEADIPFWAFAREGSHYTARLKIFQTAAIPDTSVDWSAKIGCPLDTGCTEISRFLPYKYTHTERGPQPRFGTNLLTAQTSGDSEPKPVYADGNTTIIPDDRGIYNSQLWGDSTGEGVSLYTDYGRGKPKVGYLHLSRIDESHVDPRSGATLGNKLSQRTRIGWSGQSGSSSGPHLHMIYYGYGKNCWTTEDSPTRVCGWSVQRKDPFDALVKNFSASVVSNQLTINASSSSSNLPVASKVAATAITSAIGPDFGDLGRNICITTQQPFDLPVTGSFSLTAIGVPQTNKPSFHCIPWPAQAVALFNASSSNLPNRVLFYYSSGDNRRSSSQKSILKLDSSNVEDAGNINLVYTKIDAKGHELPDDAPVWSCVLDKMTGYLWEVRLDTTLYKHPLTLLTTSASAAINPDPIKTLNDSNYCGSTSWRLPTLVELQSSVDYFSNTGTIFNVNYFINTYGSYYWSSTENEYLSFFSGSNGFDSSTGVNYMRLVSTPASASQTITTQNQSELRDSSSGLIWDRCMYGMKWDSNNSVCSGTPIPQTDLTKFFNKITELKPGWRVPDIKELTTLLKARSAAEILDANSVSALNKSISASSSAYLISSTGDASDSKSGWVIDMDKSTPRLTTKDPANSNENSRFYILLVRTEPALH